MEKHIEKAINAFMGSLNQGRTYHWMVIPKGAGATKLAFEIIRKIGNKTLIICNSVGAKFNVENYAHAYCRELCENDAVRLYEKDKTKKNGVLTLSAMHDCDSATNAKIIIAGQKHFKSSCFWDIAGMCDLVIYLDCEQCLDVDDAVFSRLKEKCSIITGITSVLDPRIGLTFGHNPISTHFGELPTFELPLGELASYFKD